MSHVKLSKEELEASIIAANNKLSHMQMKQRCDNSYAMALHARDEIREHQPLSITHQNLLSSILPALYTDKMEFDRYYGTDKLAGKLVAKKMQQCINRHAVKLQHLLGDIVHERTHS